MSESEASTIEAPVYNGLAVALAAFQAETPTFKKSKTAKVKMQAGGTYEYNYAGLGDILPVVNPLLGKHGLSWSSKPISGPNGEPTLYYRLLHASGECDEGEMPLGVPRGCRVQELGSALTSCRRYALTAQLNLAADEDDDGHVAQT
ncbi:MAG: ERF family protein, partial [Solirubrobacteraceae bacterium]